MKCVFTIVQECRSTICSFRHSVAQKQSSIRNKLKKKRLHEPNFKPPFFTKEQLGEYMEVRKSPEEEKSKINAENRKKLLDPSLHGSRSISNYRESFEGWIKDGKRTVSNYALQVSFKDIVSDDYVSLSMARACDDYISEIWVFRVGPER